MNHWIQNQIEGLIGTLLINHFKKQLTFSPWLITVRSVRKPVYRALRAAVTLVLLAFVATNSWAQVSISRGKTPIPDGNATAAEDITVRNSKLAFSIAVQSAPPWGVARGCIVDIATVSVDGTLGADRVAFADFIPNNWSAWPSSYQRIDIIKNTPDRVVIRSSRGFAEVDIETIYTLDAGADSIAVRTTMSNRGEALVDLRSGFTLWPDGGFKFAVPGFGEGAAAGNSRGDRFVGYGADWAVALHAPYVTELANQSRDLYTRHSLDKGASVTFEGYYQVVPRGDLGPVMRAEIERKALPFGTLSGKVLDSSGAAVEKPAVIVMREGIAYGWALGKDGSYQLDLPVGDYQLYAAAKGYSDSAKQRISIRDGERQTVSFEGLQVPARVELTVVDVHNNRPLDAKIQIAEGNRPVIEYMGAKTFFTELLSVGHAQFELAPGHYKIKVGAGEGFLAPAELIDFTLQAGSTLALASKIAVKTYPSQSGWYAGDLHHHSNVLEGSTPPADVIRSQLAAGLDVSFLSDHDSTANNAQARQLSEQRGVVFIPSIEISASWGHFNAYPIDKGASLSVDPGRDSIHSIIADARSMGALVIASNHPYIPYGYLSSLEKGTVPGGFNPGIDLLEINAGVDTGRVIAKAHELWSQGLRYYFTAGSDAHDVWNDSSGHNRLFVYTGGNTTALSFSRAAKDGHSYVSFGPIIYPQNVMFGDTLTLTAARPMQLEFDLLAVNTLRSVQLVGAEGVIAEQALSTMEQRVSFAVPHVKGWLALVVEDKQGNKAYSNPIWTEPVDRNQF